jgi:hypothetical protein
LIFNQSRGSVLVLALVTLLFVQFLALSMVTSVNITGHILRNHEKKRAINRDADNLINFLITHKEYFLNYSDYINAEGKFEIMIPDHIVAPPRAVEITHFECTVCPSVTAPALSLDTLLSFNNTHWVLKIEISDLQTETRVAVEQGLLITAQINSELHTLRHNQQAQNGDVMRLSIRGTGWYSR